MRHLQPTVRQLPPIRRLLAGALVAGAVVAVAPSMASAAETQSTCTYDPAFHRVTVTDNSGGARRLKITRIANGIAIEDSGATTVLCGDGSSFATVTNTDKILVNTTNFSSVQFADGVILDGSNGALAPGFTAENDGNSEIEVQLRGSGFIPTTGLEVVGTSQADTIKVGELGSVLLGGDADADVSVVNAADLAPRVAAPLKVSGGFGADFISGRGAHPAAPKPASVGLELNGGSGDDVVIDGTGRDKLNGGSGRDSLFTTDGHDGDAVTGGADADNATLDAGDTFTSDVEVNSGGIAVGKLNLAPAIVDARAGGVARVAVSWKHPKAWKALRSIEWRLMQGTAAVGTVAVKPADGKLLADGIKLVRRGSTISHEGKTVTAKLAVRVPKALAGQQLRVDVRATDGKGRTQLEPGAGLLRVAG